MIDHHKSSKPEIYREIILYDENCMISAKNKYLLKGFVDGGFECNIYTFIRPNQERLRKMKLWALRQESNLRPCDSGAAL